MPIARAGTNRQVWTAARLWHSTTAVIAAVSLVVQFVLVVLDDGSIVRYFSFFTIQSNILVLVTTAMLALRPDYDGPVFRVIRLDAVICITVTGIVHWFLLRPLPEIQNLTGWADACDVGLHVVVPLLAFLGWLGYGPRPRISGQTIGLPLLFPLGWLAYPLVHGELARWYPYPFVDVIELGYATVLANCLAFAALFLACAGLALVADRRLAPAPATE
jgi:hypothetical protein